MLSFKLSSSLPLCPELGKLRGEPRLPLVRGRHSPARTLSAVPLLGPLRGLSCSHQKPPYMRLGFCLLGMCASEGRHPSRHQNPVLDGGAFGFCAGATALVLMAKLLSPCLDDHDGLLCPPSSPCPTFVSFHRAARMATVNVSHLMSLPL